jgi:hypothetical protein
MANPSTNVPFPNFGPAGFVPPAESAILTGVQADWQTAFNNTLNFSTQGGSQVNATPQGQLATSETAVLGDNFAMFAWFCNQVDPALNSGRMQDAIARIYFISRIAGAPTTQQCICNGLQGVQVPVGLLATDTVGNSWICSQAGTVLEGGNVTLAFACTVNGPTPGPVSFPTFQAIPGLDSITPTGDASLGQLVETPAQFETRRAASVGANSMGQINAIYGNIFQNVAGMLDLYCYSNDLNTPVTIGGVTLNPNAVYVCFLGGAAADVAFAAWQKKMPGAPWYDDGNTTITVQDPNPAYAPPAPSYTVIIEEAVPVSFAVLVTIVNSASVPSNALAQIQTAIIAAFAGLDGGPRAKIGSTVLASRYYGDILALGSWAQYGALVSLQVGISGDAGSFTASISGTTMTVTGIGFSTLAVGQLIQDVAGNVLQGTTITAFGTGTGGTGTYTVSKSQTVTSETMNATNMVDSVTMNINQTPAVSAVNIMLALV